MAREGGQHIYQYRRSGAKGLLHKMDDYYKAKGWDPKTGLQKRDTLRKLNLGDIIELLEDKVV